jgi:chromosome segregation ATPase
MITLDQVRALETRVEKALGAMDRLTAENAALRETVAREKARASELERTIEEFRRDQNRIEQGILHALERLNAFEDAVLESAAAPAAKAASRAAPEDARPAPQPKAPSSVAPESASSAASESASAAKDGAAPAPKAPEAELEIF